MKVLQINTTVNSGSTGRIAEDIGQLLLNQHHQSYIAHSREDRPSKSVKIPIGSKLDVYNHVLQTRLFDTHGFNSKSATQKFVKHIAKLDLDLIHLHNIHGYFIHVGLLFDFLKESELPVVWTFHDCWPFTGHCAYYTSVNCDKWKTGCHTCPSSKKYPTSWFRDNSKNNFALKKENFNGIKNLSIVTPSHWLAQETRQSYLKDYPVHVIHNGIDTSVFKPVEDTAIKSKFNIPEKNIILGVASVWDERKGLNDFYKLNEELDESNIIVLVGLNAEQLKSVPKGIIGIPRTESLEDLAALYSAASVFINPTYSDNFPTTNIESLSSGTPVITYQTGGSPESLDEKTGFVIEHGNMIELHKTISIINANGKSHYTDNCRARAIKLFKKEERFQDYITLYNENLR